MAETTVPETIQTEETTAEETIKEIIVEPIILTGSGDSIVDVDKPNIAMVAHIVGNKSSNHFAVLNYGEDGNKIGLLVNTTDPYDGIIPLDFENGEWTSRFEIKASGDWKIELLQLSSLRVLLVPGIIEGKGDEVFLLGGETPDLAKIEGNSKSSHFAVLGYNGGRDLLVNTTDPYSGSVIINSKTMIIEVKSVGSWKIDITAK